MKVSWDKIRRFVGGGKTKKDKEGGFDFDSSKFQRSYSFKRTSLRRSITNSGVKDRKKIKSGTSIANSCLEIQKSTDCSSSKKSAKCSENNYFAQKEPAIGSDNRILVMKRSERAERACELMSSLEGDSDFEFFIENEIEPNNIEMRREENEEDFNKRVEEIDDRRNENSLIFSQRVEKGQSPHSHHYATSDDDDDHKLSSELLQSPSYYLSNPQNNLQKSPQLSHQQHLENKEMSEVSNFISKNQERYKMRQLDPKAIFQTPPPPPSLFKNDFKFTFSNKENAPDEERDDFKENENINRFKNHSINFPMKNNDHENGGIDGSENENSHDVYGSYFIKKTEHNDLEKNKEIVENISQNYILSSKSNTYKICDNPEGMLQNMPYSTTTEGKCLKISQKSTSYDEVKNLSKSSINSNFSFLLEPSCSKRGDKIEKIPSISNSEALRPDSVNKNEERLNNIHLNEDKNSNLCKYNKVISSSVDSLQKLSLHSEYSESPRSFWWTQKPGSSVTTSSGASRDSGFSLSWASGFARVFGKNPKVKRPVLSVSKEGYFQRTNCKRASAQKPKLVVGRGRNSLKRAKKKGKEVVKSPHLISKSDLIGEEEEALDHENSLVERIENCESYNLRDGGGNKSSNSLVEDDAKSRVSNNEDYNEFNYFDEWTKSDYFDERTKLSYEEEVIFVKPQWRSKNVNSNEVDKKKVGAAKKSSLTTQERGGMIKSCKSGYRRFDTIEIRLPRLKIIGADDDDDDDRSELKLIKTSESDIRLSNNNLVDSKVEDDSKSNSECDYNNDEKYHRENVYGNDIQSDSASSSILLTDLSKNDIQTSTQQNNEITKHKVSTFQRMASKKNSDLENKAQKLPIITSSFKRKNSASCQKSKLGQKFTFALPRPAIKAEPKAYFSHSHIVVHQKWP